MSDNLSKCPHCGFHYEGTFEFCPQCRVRLGHFVKAQVYNPTLEELSTPAPDNVKELTLMANFCSVLAGLSIGWPLYAVGLFLFREVSTKAFLAFIVGLVPAAIGLVLFSLASMSFRDDARRKGDGTKTVWGMLCAICAAGSWWMAANFLMTGNF